MDNSAELNAGLWVVLCVPGSLPLPGLEASRPIQNSYCNRFN